MSDRESKVRPHPQCPVHCQHVLADAERNNRDGTIVLRQMTASFVLYTTLSTMPTNRLTKKGFLAEGPTVDITIAFGMLTNISTQIIPTRVMITVIDGATEPSNAVGRDE